VKIRATSQIKNQRPITAKKDADKKDEKPKIKYNSFFDVDTETFNDLKS